MTVLAAIAVAAWLVLDEWLIAASILMLGVIWIVLRAKEGPPVLALAMTLQWVQVTIGLFYVNLTGRPVEATLMSDYRPMVAVGLGCLAILVAGLWCSQRLIDRLGPPKGERPEHALPFAGLLICYGIATAGVGAMQQLAWSYPAITQAILALTYLRLALLYLILRRLARGEQWHLIAPLLGLEVALGFTGFYAGFREPLILAMLAFLEVFDRRSVRHWLYVGGLAFVMCVLGMFWISARQGYRERILTDEAFAQSQSKRLSEIKDLSSGWLARDARDFTASADQFVDRLWTVYYPALALARVPAVVPHTNGKLMSATIEHLLTPRIFYPDKPVLGSESELVRKYSGVWVASDKEQTNIAFGYAAESYVDFGIPLMFVPVWLYGVLIGAMYAALLRLIHHRDLAVSVVTVIAWSSLYLFERSWAKTIGLAATLLVYAGGVTVLLDQIWLQRFTSPAADDPANLDLFAPRNEL